MPTSGFSINIWFLTQFPGVAREGDLPPPPGKLNVKTGAPLADIMLFSTVLVSVGCHFLRFSGWLRFFSQKKHLRHQSALLFLCLFSECWLVALYGGQWASFS